MPVAVSLIAGAQKVGGSSGRPVSVTTAPNALQQRIEPGRQL
jgi:hypothetical protein